jgi:hypothetical protein
MSDGEYLNAIEELLEDNVIREAVDREAPRRPDHGRNPGTCRGKPFDQFERSFNLRHKPLGDIGVTFAIPRGGLLKILARLTLNEQQFQRRSTSVRIFSRATRQSVPGSSEAISDRRSISSAQAF